MITSYKKLHDIKGYDACVEALKHRHYTIIKRMCKWHRKKDIEVDKATAIRDRMANEPSLEERTRLQKELIETWDRVGRMVEVTARCGCIVHQIEYELDYLVGLKRTRKWLEDKKGSPLV